MSKFVTTASGNNIEIRDLLAFEDEQVALKEMEEVHRLLSKTFDFNKRDDLPDGMVNLEIFSKHFKRSINEDALDQMYILAAHGEKGELAGAAVFSVYKDQDKRMAFIAYLGVKEEHRNKGYGMTLSEYMNDYARSLVGDNGIIFSEIQMTREGKVPHKTSYEDKGYRHIRVPYVTNNNTDPTIEKKHSWVLVVNTGSDEGKLLSPEDFRKIRVRIDYYMRGEDAGVIPPDVDIYPEKVKANIPQIKAIIEQNNGIPYFPTVKEIFSPNVNYISL